MQPFSASAGVGSERAGSGVVSPNLTSPSALQVRAAGEAGTGWRSCLLLGGDGLRFPAGAIWLKGRRDKRLSLYVREGLRSPGSPVYKKGKDPEAFLFPLPV